MNCRMLAFRESVTAACICFGCLMVCGRHSDSKNEIRIGVIATVDDRSRAFTHEYRQAYDHEPGNMAAMTFDAFGLLFQAIKNEGSAEPESIRKGLSNIENFKGVSGVISYRGSGDPEKSAVILKIEGGEAVFHKMVNPL